MGMKSNTKKRHWTCVVYPESAPADWIETLQHTGLEFAISPLHDKDINADGEPKKAHYHVILVYPGPTTFSNVCTLVVETLGQPFPQPCDSVKGCFRYFTHMDNPDKYQYDQKDVRCVNGFNIADFAELTMREKSQIRASLIGLIREQHMTEYATLINYLLDNEMTTEFEIASSSTVFFRDYIASFRFGPQTDSTVKVDKDTGEILE